MDRVVFEGVGKRYGRQWALRSVDANFREGEVVMVIGPNGSGKTTLIKCLLGLVRPTEGRISVEGTVIGQDPALLEKVRHVRQYGWRKRYVSDHHGRNSRLDELQAAILRVHLTRLEAGNRRRDAIARQYLAALADAPLKLPVVAGGRTHTWHQFVVRSARRDELQAHLAKQDIVCGVLYPMPIHRQPAYHDATLSLPQTEQACAEVLSLPLHPGLGDDDVARVVKEVKAFLG